jgi:hypothetical protein
MYDVHTSCEGATIQLATTIYDMYINCNAKAAAAAAKMAAPALRLIGNSTPELNNLLADGRMHACRGLLINTSLAVELISGRANSEAAAAVSGRNGFQADDGPAKCIA